VPLKTKTSYNFTCCFVWVWDLVSYTEWGI